MLDTALIQNTVAMSSKGVHTLEYFCLEQCINQDLQTAPKKSLGKYVCLRVSCAEDYEGQDIGNQNQVENVWGHLGWSIKYMI